LVEAIPLPHYKEALSIPQMNSSKRVCRFRSLKLDLIFRAGNFVMPTITRVSPEAPCAQHEVFVPILHTMSFDVIRQIH
jgi:acyl-CoA reductase-like NAD-dependent aldehyde dehydrogenase